MSAASRLAAILFMDLAGFPELLAGDERGALIELSRYRQTAGDVIAEHQGELVDATAAELLVAFGSAVAAAQCALHLSLALRAAPGEASPPLKPRMGLHLGEIWQESGRVFGNGVNIAARVMQVAPPGALLASEDLYRQIESKLDLDARLADCPQPKNIERRLAIYEIDTGSGFLAGAHDGRDMPTAEPAERLPREVPAAPDPGSPAASRPSAMGSELGRSIKQQVMDALSRNLDISISLGSGQAPRPPKPVPPARPMVPDKPQRRLDADTEGLAVHTGTAAYNPEDKARARLASAVSSLAVKLCVGAGLAYAYASTGSIWYLLGTVFIGVLPALSSAKKIRTAVKDIRRNRLGGK